MKKLLPITLLLTGCDAPHVITWSGETLIALGILAVAACLLVIYLLATGLDAMVTRLKVLVKEDPPRAARYAGLGIVYVTIVVVVLTFGVKCH